jgi:hypothetical protein
MPAKPMRQATLPCDGQPILAYVCAPKVKGVRAAYVSRAQALQPLSQIQNVPEPAKRGSDTKIIGPLENEPRLSIGVLLDQHCQLLAAQGRVTPGCMHSSPK